jgi:hypothetical protein
VKTITILLAFSLPLASSSTAWAVQDYDRQWMYCPIGTKHYGKVVLRDIRYCDGTAWRRANPKTKKN